MAANSKISWTDYTFNPVRGCAKVSLGCDNCYAEAMSKRNPAVLGTWGEGAARAVAAEPYWKYPLRWNREAEKAGERRRVFCASLADVFEDHPTWIEPRRRLFGLINETPNLDWLLLTKRPENAALLSFEAWHTSDLQLQLPDNVWLGVTVENQEMADQRIPDLLKIPARVRFLSCEPLLGPVSLRWLAAWPENAPTTAQNPYRGGVTDHLDGLRRLDWIICGGESGPNARPSHPDWFRALRDECAAADVPFHFKQHGEWIGGKFDRRKSKMICDATEQGAKFGRIFWTNPGEPKVHLWDKADHCWANASARVGKKAAGRLLDGHLHDAFPQFNQSSESERS